MLGRRHRKITAVGRTGGSKIRVGWLLAAVLFLFVMAIPLSVLAQTASNQLASGLESAQAIGLGSVDIRTAIARIINYFFGLMGIVAVALFVYGGYTYMMAKGEVSQIDKAKQIMVSAVIGMIIILSSYAIAQFVIRAIFGAGGAGGGSGGSGDGTAVTSGYCQGCGPEHLGNGIITYHYPEANQTDVPRNVSLAIKFKKPLLLSTVLRDYDDKGTYAVEDDEFCGSICEPIDWENPPAFYLNTDNIKILPSAELQEIVGSSADEYFDSRYESPRLISDARAFVSQVATEFNPNNLGQDLVIVPGSPLGSSQEEMGYRVGLRGGDRGLMVWNWDSVAGEPQSENAFEQLNPDGSYYWNFTTGTLLDLTPPEVTAVIPVSRPNPTGEKLYRNQLLQIYFSKPMNPVTVSGINGSGGFNLIEVRYKDGTDWKPLDGTWVTASGYRAIEYTPESPCDTIFENSCGDAVYCLPGNAQLAVIVRAPTLSDSPPRAAIIGSSGFNGVVDMVSNALDGDADGELEGPGGVNPAGFGFVNSSVIPGTLVTTNFSNDSLVWFYYVGNGIDLVPPVITGIDPPNNSDSPWREDGTGGASKFPVDRPLTSEWSKPMSISSMITGPDTYQRATITLRAREIPSRGEVPGPPGYVVIPNLINDNRQTVMTMKHRTFFTANDLGWSPEEAVSNPNSVPIYIPVFKSRLKDVRQNCFFPSEAVNCDSMDDSNRTHCCGILVSNEINPMCQQ